MISRVVRATELRVERIELDAAARAFIADASRGTIRLVANQRDAGDEAEYRVEGQQKRKHNHIPPGEPILFFEVTVCDPSDFTDVLRVKGVQVDGHKVLRAESAAVPNSIAAFLLYLRDHIGTIPHVYFDWTEGNPIVYLLKYLAFGEGYTAPVTREVLRRAEPDIDRRPIVHVGE